MYLANKSVLNLGVWEWIVVRFSRLRRDIVDDMMTMLGGNRIVLWG